jgi:hypothetical protein
MIRMMRIDVLIWLNPVHPIPLHSVHIAQLSYMEESGLPGKLICRSILNARSTVSFSLVMAIGREKSSLRFYNARSNSLAKALRWRPGKNLWINWKLTG